MGVHICLCDKENKNVVKDSSLDCYKNTEQNIFGNIITANNIVTTNNSKKININNYEENNIMKMKFKKIIKENNTNSNSQKKRKSSLKKSNYMKNVIKIQRWFKKYLKAKKLRSDFENILIEDAISLKLNLGESVFSSVSYHNSNISPDKNSQYNKTDVEDPNILFDFNIKNKLKMKYKYSGYIKKGKNKKSTKSSSDEKDYNENEDKSGMIKEGYGKFIFNDGTEFSGIFNNNVLQHYGRYSNLNQGNVNNKHEKEIIIANDINYEEFIGEYKDYVPDGFGIYKNYITNLKIKGIFKGNSILGIGIEKSVEGGYVYEGDFVNNKKEGYGTMKWKDGYIYQGEFKNNQMNGYGIIQYPGNNYYQGEVKNGRMEGFGEFFWKNDKKYIGHYKNDQRAGFGILIVKNNQFNKLVHLNENENNFVGFIGFWKNGNMDGFGMKVSKTEVKYGIWENGIKKKNLDSAFAFKTYIKWMNQSYINLFLSQHNELITFLEKCLMIDKDINPVIKDS